MKVPIPIEICRKGAEVPVYKTPGSAGMDVKAAEGCIIYPGETVTIPTGLKMAIPEGYEIQVRNRSGISRETPLRVSNSPGTLDSDYRDEIGVLLTNESPITPVTSATVYSLSSMGNKKGAYQVEKGDRVAQLVLKEAPTAEFHVVKSVENIGHNRGGGFGHTGIADE